MRCVLFVVLSCLSIQSSKLGIIEHPQLQRGQRSACSGVDQFIEVLFNGAEMSKLLKEMMTNASHAVHIDFSDVHVPLHHLNYPNYILPSLVQISEELSRALQNAENSMFQITRSFALVENSWFTIERLLGGKYPKEAVHAHLPEFVSGFKARVRPLNQLAQQSINEFSKSKMIIDELRMLFEAKMDKLTSKIFHYCVSNPVAKICRNSMQFPYFHWLGNFSPILPYAIPRDAAIQTNRYRMKSLNNQLKMLEQLQQTLERIQSVNLKGLMSVFEKLERQFKGIERVADQVVLKVQQIPELSINAFIEQRKTFAGLKKWIKDVAGVYSVVSQNVYIKHMADVSKYATTYLSDEDYYFNAIHKLAQDFTDAKEKIRNTVNQILRPRSVYSKLDRQEYE